jgi:anti-sigma28 factor (negative regulator of flagellin synthesis)
MEVEKGTYAVPAHRIASDMLKESFENDIILQKVNTRA